MRNKNRIEMLCNAALIQILIRCQVGTTD